MQNNIINTVESSESLISGKDHQKYKNLDLSTQMTKKENVLTGLNFLRNSQNDIKNVNKTTKGYFSNDPYLGPEIYRKATKQNSNLDS